VRTTLDIEDDVLAAVRDLALRQGLSVDQMMSRLLRAALRADAVSVPSSGPSATVAGFRAFAAPAGPVVSNEQIDQLRDAAGL
jgi:hypothetical protein